MKSCRSNAISKELDESESAEQEAEPKIAAQTTFTTMKIPRDLVAAVRRLVASHSKAVQ